MFTRLLKIIFNETFFKIAGSIALFVFLFYFDYSRGNGETFISLFWDDYFDRSILTSFIIITGFNLFTHFAFTYYRNKSEERIKIASTKEDISKFYKTYEKNQLIQISDPHDEKTSMKFPGILLYSRPSKNDSITIEVVDSKTQFTLPPLANKYYDDLLSSHYNSTIYNNLAIRLKDFKNQNNTLTFYPKFQEQVSHFLKKVKFVCYC